MEKMKVTAGLDSALAICNAKKLPELAISDEDAVYEYERYAKSWRVDDDALHFIGDKDQTMTFPKPLRLTSQDFAGSERWINSKCKKIIERLLKLGIPEASIFKVEIDGSICGGAPDMTSLEDAEATLEDLTHIVCFFNAGSKPGEEAYGLFLHYFDGTFSIAPILYFDQLTEQVAGNLQAIDAALFSVLSDVL
jgi:hypothetical protein